MSTSAGMSELYAYRLRETKEVFVGQEGERTGKEAMWAEPEGQTLRNGITR